MIIAVQINVDKRRTEEKFITGEKLMAVNIKSRGTQSMNSYNFGIAYSTLNGGPTTFISCSRKTFAISSDVGGEVQASVTLKKSSILPAGR